MQTQGYTVFSGPLKHDSKSNDPAKKLEHAGQDAQVVRKNQHHNKHNQLDPKHVAKMLNSEQDHLPPSMPHELRLAISQARNDKGWNQQQFAKHCQIPKHDITAFENGKQLPTGQQIVTMEGVLGVKLPRPPKNHH